MIDPFENMVNYQRTPSELEEFWLFAIAVAGKKAATVAKLFNSFLYDNEFNNGKRTPFQIVKAMDDSNELLSQMQRARLGMYSKLETAYRQSLSLNLHSCSILDLESIKGVGKKTSRFFISFSRENQKLAILDVHIMRYLRNQGHDAPDKTPAGKEYDHWEKVFLQIAESSNRTPAELDFEIWKSSARRNT